MEALVRILMAVIVVQFCMLTFYLYITKKGKPLPNRLLGTFFLLFAINLGEGTLGYTGFFLQFPSLALIEDGLVLLYGPILFFFIKSLSKL
jgi:hypothetical protein